MSNPGLFLSLVMLAWFTPIVWQWCTRAEARKAWKNLKEAVAEYELDWRERRELRRLHKNEEQEYENLQITLIECRHFVAWSIAKEKHLQNQLLEGQGATKCDQFEKLEQELQCRKEQTQVMQTCLAKLEAMVQTQYTQKQIVIAQSTAELAIRRAERSISRMKHQPKITMEVLDELALGVAEREAHAVIHTSAHLKRITDAEIERLSKVELLQQLADCLDHIRSHKETLKYIDRKELLLQTELEEICDSPDAFGASPKGGVEYVRQSKNMEKELQQLKQFKVNLTRVVTELAVIEKKLTTKLESFAGMKHPESALSRALLENET